MSTPSVPQDDVQTGNNNNSGSIATATATSSGSGSGSVLPQSRPPSIASIAPLNINMLQQPTPQQPQQPTINPLPQFFMHPAAVAASALAANPSPAPPGTTITPATNPYLTGFLSAPISMATAAGTPLPLSSIPSVIDASRTTPFHLFGRPSTSAASAVPTCQQHTPDVFFNRKIRSGKWIPEEEKYAERLIELFEKGHIVGIENGCTLRSYLSQKLHCAPMRISKKFAGKGIGKMVYMSRTTTPTTPTTTTTTTTSDTATKDNAETDSAKSELEKLLEQVREAQEKFYQAVCPSKDALAISLNGFMPPLCAPPTLGLLPGVIPMMSTRHAMPFPMVAGFNPAAFAMPSVTLPIATSLQAAAQTIQPCDATKMLASATTVPSLTAATTIIPSAATTTTTSNSLNSSAASFAQESQKELRESFLKALYEKQQQENETACSEPDQASLQQNQPMKPLHHACTQPPVTSSPTGNSFQSSSTSSPHGFPVPSVTSNPASSESSTRNASPPVPPLKAQGDDGSRQGSAGSTITPLPSRDTPDFMAGFEQIAKLASSFALASTSTSQQAPWVVNDSQQYHSQPTTSRTLDDGQKYQGNDGMHVDETSLQGANTTLHEVAKQSNSNNSFPPFNTSTALFTAESYAIFAQESAMAASQHDAYLPRAGGISPFGDGANKNHLVHEHFDIDGMVKMVSEHINHHCNQQHRTNFQEQQQQEHHAAVSPLPPAFPNNTQLHSKRPWEPKPPLTTAMTNSSSMRFAVSVSEPSEPSSNGCSRDNSGGSSDSNGASSASSSNESDDGDSSSSSSSEEEDSDCESNTFHSKKKKRRGQNELSFGVSNSNTNNSNNTAVDDYMMMGSWLAASRCLYGGPSGETESDNQQPKKAKH